MNSWQQAAQLIFSAALFFCLLPLSYHDLTARRLPNRLVALVAVLGCLRCLLLLTGVTRGQVLCQSMTKYLTPCHVVGQVALGVAYAVGPAALVAGAYWLLRRRSGLGMGDIKLLAALGLFFGPRAFWILPLASCLCVTSLPVLALWRKKKGRGYALSSSLPFGPYIAAGAVILLMAAPALLTY
ncbi:MAG: A24 family peptidase [Coriobacteriia bacterium]|nr:A24 family peptidase [Coriobacteriia bacterium]